MINEKIKLYIRRTNPSSTDCYLSPMPMIIRSKSVTQIVITICKDEDDDEHALREEKNSVD